MKHQIKILLLEDSALDAELIKRELIKGLIDHEMLVVPNKIKFQEALETYPADIILSDHSLPNFSSHEALKMVQAAGVVIPFILITATMTDEFAVKIMKEGAHDYIIKDRLSRLPSAITNLIEKFQLICEQTAERVKVNEELNRLNYRLKLATQSANLGIWDWDIVNNKLDWDDGMCRLYNICGERFDSPYEAWTAMLHPEDRDQINEEIQSALRDEKKYDTEFRVVDDKQCVHTMRATGTVEWDGTGVPVRMIGVNWDITKRKLAAMEREAIIGEVSRRNGELEQFGYIISHNLRAPVANIMGASSALDDPELAEDDRLFYYRAVQHSALSLDHIIKDLNHLLELKAGNHTKELVCFSELTDDIKSVINDKLIADQFNVTYDFSMVDELFSIKAYLYSIFYNLISNSFKYRRKDIKGKLEIRSERLNNKIVFVFTDNGLGFNLEKNKEQVFGLYQRFHTDFPGSGMGLFMVKSQVEILGGSITVESIENKGAIFRVELPFNKSS
jgi:signal transduction histidine kinase/DNA-binding NarL/FixJ family response regulator